MVINMNKIMVNDKHIFTIRTLEKIDIGVIATSMVASDKSIFVFGGDNDEFFTSSAEVRMYDIESQKWNKLKGMPHYTWAATAQIIDDKIFIMGGGRKFSYMAYNLVYNIKYDYWEEKARLPMSRKGLVSGVIDDIIYVACGYHIDKREPCIPYCYAYNPKTDTWKQCTSAKNPRSLGMSVVVDKFLYVLGGYVLKIVSKNVSSSVLNNVSMERYCPKTDSWETMPSMPRGRIGSVAVAIDSKIFVLCGVMEEDYTTMDYYDTRTRKWTISNIQTPELMLHGVAVIDNKIYLTAGRDFKEEYNRDLYEITYGGMKEGV